jgi:hypothetical protein
LKKTIYTKLMTGPQRTDRRQIISVINLFSILNNLKSAVAEAEIVPYTAAEKYFFIL